MPKSRSVSSGPNKLPVKPIQFVVGAVGVAVLVAGALIVINQLSARPPAPATTTINSVTKTTAYEECPNLISGYSKTMGSPDAPVQIIEFADYQCPVCGRFATEYEPQLIHDYVCTGKVSFTYKDFAFIGTNSKPDESLLASQAADCAADQGQFWAYHDKLFNNQRGENRGAFNASKLKGFAQDLKLNMDSFSQCLDSGKYASQVGDEKKEGESRGVNATPILFVNDQTLQGLPPSYNDLRQAIDKALAQTS